MLPAGLGKLMQAEGCSPGRVGQPDQVAPSVGPLKGVPGQEKAWPRQVRVGKMQYTRDDGMVPMPELVLDLGL